MKYPRLSLHFAFASLLLSAPRLAAQDNVRGSSEPIVASIDPSKLTYDILVDADLPANDAANKKFKSLQAAYEAAPAGTEAKPTVIALKPGVHFIPRPGPRTPSIAINKNWITFLGLTNNRRAVVIADNCGLFQGADDDGYMLDVNATGFTLRNLTVVNYCNQDYEYPGDPSKNLKMRNPVITQAVALQCQGDKHVYENVAFLSRLDTTFIRTTRAYFKNVFIEGTDDWMGGGQMGVWEDSTLVYPTGRGVMSAANLVFINCRFEAARGMEFYKVEYNAALRPVALINCIVPENTAWNRGKTPPRPTQYSLTYHVKYPNGQPAKIADGTVGPKVYEYGRELSDREVAAFNPWNLLRAAPGAPAPDDWDPAGVKEKYASQGNLPFRMSFTGGGGAPRPGGVFGAMPTPPTIRTGGPNESTKLGATITPTRADNPTITWSTKSKLVTLSDTTGPSCTVTARNNTDRAEFVPINATASNGICITAWVYAEPKFIDPPVFATAPTLAAPAKGIVNVNYALDLRGKDDQSLISWSICDDASGANSRSVAVSRGNEPLKSLVLTPGYVGKFLQVSIQPKHPICEAGPAVTATSAKPIAADDVASTTVSPNFRNFVADKNETYVSGLWTVLGASAWTVAADERLLNGYGVRPPTAGTSSLLYQQDADTGDMQIDLLMSPEKTEGTGFSIPGSPADNDATGRGDRNLHADVLIKYDPRTKNGYALRFWRTQQAPGSCLYQFYKIENGAGSPLSDKQALTGVFKPTTHMTIKATGNKLTATASNDRDGETLSLTDTIVPNRFGGAGVNWPRGSTNTYSRIEISYPNSAPSK